ncbi:MAG: TnpV protein [Oscillospiraceae bacterium]|nr:TnpV protein [Oscillospiraceae bacterium]
MEKYITDELTGLTYKLIGEHYYIAGEELEDQPIGIWEQQHLRYIKEHKRLFYLNLLTTGKLNEYLAEVNSRAQNMYYQLIKELSEKEGINENLKERNQMQWVKEMNNVRNRAVEMVHRECIFAI